MTLEEKKPGTKVESGETPTEQVAEGGGVPTEYKAASLKLVVDNTRKQAIKERIVVDDEPVSAPKRPPIQTFPKTLTGLEAPEFKGKEDPEFLKRLAEAKKNGEEMVEASKESLRSAGLPKDLYPIEDEPTLEIVEEDEPTLPGKFVPKVKPRLQNSLELMQTMKDDGLLSPEQAEKILEASGLPQSVFRLPPKESVALEEIKSAKDLIEDQRDTMPEIKHVEGNRADSGVRYVNPEDRREFPQILPSPIAQPKTAPVVKKRSTWRKFTSYVGAAALGIFATLGVYKATEVNQNESLAPAASASAKVPESLSTNRIAPAPSLEISAKPVVKIEQNVPKSVPQVIAPVKTETSAVVPARTLHAVKILKMSKNKVLNSTLENGEFIMPADSTLLDSMIWPYMGMASQEQEVKIKELQRELQLGLMMHMYEQFGTPAKLATSLKNPELANLYKTVKTWKLINIEKRLDPAYAARAKELARRVMEDGAGLGHDKADKPERALQINGNVFQARAAGNVVKMRYENGKKHVLLERMDEIFYGGISQIMDKAPAASSAPAVAPAAPIVNSQDKFLPNIAEDLEAIDAGWDDFIEAPKNSGEKNNVEKTELEKIDAGWDEIINDNSGQNLINEIAEFEKTGVVKFELPKGLTTREENNMLLQELQKKVKELMPNADAKVVERVLKQFEFRAVKRQVKNGRFVEMELNSRFREILRYELNKGKIGV